MTSHVARLLLPLLLLLAPQATTAQLGPPVAVSAGRVVTVPDFPSKQIDPLTIWVWLPAEYDRDATRSFPVIYMHDGQNLFDKARAGYGQEWQMDEAISRMSAAGQLQPYIVVGIASPKARYATLFPEKILTHLPPAFQDRVRGINLGPEKGAPKLMGDAYLKFLTGELKQWVDGRFRTLGDRANTSVMGSSMGGLMSLYAMGEYPDVFGQAAAVSMHLPLADPNIPEADRAAAAQAVADAFGKWLGTTKLDPKLHRLYRDHGTATLDEFYPPYAAAFDNMMAARGWRWPHFEARSFTGTAHNETAWAERVDIPLLFLDRRKPKP
jgi:enterochelin esterase-like enzyme